MDVLLIGGNSRVMDAMIDRWSKDGHRVFLLTGKQEKDSSYKHVFEKYHFTYDSGMVKDIFNSIHPDITIFMGAYDTNFDWSQSREEIVRYTTGLTNILSAFSLFGKKRFVYLSSQEVYGDPKAGNIAETEPVSPRGFKAMALAQGEEICANYRKAQGVDALILRFDHIYGIPAKGQRDENPCFRMCLEALKTGSISVNEKNIFSMLYLNDAVELSYKAMKEEIPQNFCYNFSSMEEIREIELAQLICEKMGEDIEIINNSVGENYRIVLDSSRYQEEFGQRIFTDYAQGVEQVVQFMKRYSNSFLESKDFDIGWAGKLTHQGRTILGKLFPFVENLVAFIPFFMLNNRAVGSAYFNRLDFYLLYVLLFAMVHGQQQAIFSAILAVGGYFFRQMYARTGFDVLLDYNTYVWIAQLFILGMVVGYMKDQIKDIRNENEEELRYLREKMNDISDINDSNIRMRENFELQVVNQRDSLGKIYEITSGLERYAPEEVLFQAAQVLAQLMDSRSVAIYVVANQDYARLFSSTSLEARKLGNSLKYTDMEGLYGELKEHRVYINRTMEADIPLMATGVYENDKLQFILMLWDIPWQRMTLAEANRLTIIGYLIKDAIVRARNHLDALKNERYVKGTNILNSKAFASLVKAFFEAKDQGLTECELIKIPMEGLNREQMAEALGCSMRQTDYMGFLEDGELQVLLPNTDREGAEIVRRRLQSAKNEHLH